MRRVKKYEIVAFSISFGSARLHPATPVIDAREYETLVSGQQTICEYRPAKPKRKNNNKSGYAGKTTDGCESAVMDAMGAGGEV